MSNDASTPLVADTLGQSETGALTPEAIERVLANFRDWLENLPPIDPTIPEGSTPVDLHTLVGQFIALRQEVNLQTKATRASLEQNAETLRKLAEPRSNDAKPPVEHSSSVEDSAIKPLLKSIIDVYDALALADRQVARQQEKFLLGMDAIVEAAIIEPPPPVASPLANPQPGFWQRLFGARVSGSSSNELEQWRERTLQAISERKEKVRETSHFVRQALEGLLTGYAMSKNRIDRILTQFGLETISCEGQRFDPEKMEVVEVVSDSNKPSGEVLEVVRRGYIRNNAVFRYAQVRIAK